MKKRILGLVLLTGGVFSSQAQKGTLLVYGIGGFHREKDADNDKTTMYTFSPGIGYQYSANWTAGIAGSYGREKFSPAAGVGNRTSTYKTGGFIRYTHTFNNIFSLFGQGDAYYQGSKLQDIQSNGWGVSVVPTVGINVSNGFALNISFGGISYETIKAKHADRSTDSFEMNFGQQIAIGFSKNFAR